MLSKMIGIKKANTHYKFQVLFLRNDNSQEVEVHEVRDVDFVVIQEHLEHGESVFITSKNSQKIKAPKVPETRGSNPQSMKAKLATAFSLDHA